MSEQWTALELRHLATLRAIAEAGSFHGAAAILGHVPSVVSQQLTALEAIVGVRLVDRGRGRRTVSLTHAGQVLLRHAEVVEARLGAARADLRALAEGTAGTLRVGTYQSVSARILPTLLPAFAGSWPDVALEVHDAIDDRELLPLIESGALDLAFSALPAEDGPFEMVELLRDPWLLLTQPRSPLAARPRPLRLGDLAGTPLIAFAAGNGVQLRLEEAFHAKGLVPHIVLRANESAAIHGLVASGYASALMPALAVDLSHPGLALVEMDVEPRGVTIVWHADRTHSPAAAAFVEQARAVCSDVAKAWS